MHDNAARRRDNGIQRQSINERRVEGRQLKTAVAGADWVPGEIRTETNALSITKCRWNKPYAELFLAMFTAMLMIGGKCSCLRVKSAHLVWHLP
jgi:hypothetical protein